MIRSLFTFFTVLIVTGLVWLGNIAPVAAQVQPTDITDPQQELGELVQKAFEATNEGKFPAAETFWTQIIDKFPSQAAAWSNRGNSRVSQNKLQAAITDYERAIELAPDAPDPYLNRGTALEGLGRWEEAIADYNHVLELDSQDPAAYNNRGNAEAGLGQWEQAIADYILENPNKVSHSSISDLSAELGIADSTFFQFTKTLGFNGFKDFKVALLKQENELKSRIKARPAKKRCVKVLRGSLNTFS